MPNLTESMYNVIEIDVLHNM